MMEELPHSQIFPCCDPKCRSTTEELSNQFF